MVKIVILIIFPVLLFANVIDDYSNYEKRLKELQENIKNQDKYLKEIEDSKQNLSKKIKVVQDKIISQEETVKLLNIQIKSLNKQIEDTDKLISRLSSEIDTLTDQISKSNIYLIDNKGITNIKILLFSKDYHTLIKNMEIIKYVNENILSKIEEVNKKKEEITALKDDLEIKHKDLSNITVLRKNALEELKNEKLKLNQLLALLKEDEENKKEYIKILNSKYSELQKKLDSLKVEFDKEGGSELKNSLFYKTKGAIMWPAVGKVIEHYGPKKIEDFKGEIFNKGIKIKLENDGHVRAVFDGNVKYIDWIRGYGNIVIVNHDKFFYTLYANLDKVFVTLGQNVKKGEDIGLIDVDANNISPYLYFEIRKQDVAVNPEEWLAAGGGKR